jgi:predicted regulator of Ras-like GTPase activity (Roadblock/LC7/MglB family)
VSLEGLPLVSLVLEKVEETRFAAMTAAMLSLGERVSTELNKGLLKKIFVEGEHGYIISMQAGDNAVLTVSATMDTKLGLLFLDMQRATDKIAKILSYH